MGFKWSLVSIPDHVGVQNVGGRIGAAFGPRAFSECFAKMNGHRPNEVSLKSQLTSHFTLETISASVEENHVAAAKLVREAAAGADRTIVVGGGHDHGYSHLLGFHNLYGASKKIGCINLDAHFDLRRPNPKISSGSPFFLAIESGVLCGENLYEIGIQTQCNTPELWSYAVQKNVTIVTLDEFRHSESIFLFKQSLEKLARQVDTVVISVDLDSVAEGFAPGVSAPQSEGFTPMELIEFCEVAGANEKVVTLGIFELNPLHDVGNRTARLAATCAFRFLEKARSIRN